MFADETVSFKANIGRFAVGQDGVVRASQFRVFEFGQTGQFRDRLPQFRPFCSSLRAKGLAGLSGDIFLFKIVQKKVDTPLRV